MKSIKSAVTLPKRLPKDTVQLQLGVFHRQAILPGKDPSQIPSGSDSIWSTSYANFKMSKQENIHIAVSEIDLNP